MGHPDIDWEDLRVFLALAGKGSIRAAARDLAVTHPTVSRRIAALEKRLHARLFERLPSGYALTPAGQEVLGSTVQIEELVQEIGRRVLGVDARLSGRLRVTLPLCIAELLMPDFDAFAGTNPNIDLEIESSSSYADLSRRDADIAIRLTKAPPEELVGRRVTKFAYSIYASLAYLADHNPVAEPSRCMWIASSGDAPYPVWVKKSAYGEIPVGPRVDHSKLRLAAAIAGMGITTLSCLEGDSEASLRRLPPGEARTDLDVWILTHPDLRNTTRVRAFRDFITQALKSRQTLIEGRQPQRSWQPPVA